MHKVRDDEVWLASSSYLLCALCGLHFTILRWLCTIENVPYAIALLKKENSELKKKAGEADDTSKLKNIKV